MHRNARHISSTATRRVSLYIESRVAARDGFHREEKLN